MHPSGIDPVAFFWGMIVAWGHILTWRHKNLLWYGFCPHIWGRRLKTNQKGLDYKCTPMVLVLLLSFEGTHSRLGAQKPLLVRILPSHSGVKTKNQNKKVLITNAPQWCWSCCFLLGHISRSLGGPQFSLRGHGPEMTPWHQACMDVSVGNLLHWFYSLDVI